MSKPKSSKPGPKVFFVSFEPTKEQKVMIDKWCVDGGQLVQALCDCVDSGYRVSCAPDAYNRCYQCSVSRQEQPEDGLPVILQGRGSSAEKALRRALFALSEVYDGALPAYERIQSRDEDF